MCIENPTITASMKALHGMNREDVIYFLQLLRLRNKDGGAQIQNTVIENVNFSHLDLSHINFLGCQLILCDFSHCNMFDTNFVNCELRYNKFTGTDLSDCNMYSTMTKFITKSSLEALYHEMRTSRPPSPTLEEACEAVVAATLPPVINMPEPSSPRLRLWQAR